MSDSDECVLCGKTKIRWSSPGNTTVHHGTVICEMHRGDMWVCEECVKSTEMASRYRKALEEVRRLLEIFPADEASLKCWHAADAALKEGE